MNKRVVCAAIRNKKNGRIITGARHYDSLMIATINYSKEDWDKPRDVEQGFIDQYGNFLTREEAFIIASENNQIIRKCGSEHSGKLYSENLY